MTTRYMKGTLLIFLVLSSLFTVISVSAANPIYTSIFDSFMIGSSSAWTDYDIYTEAGVPKGAIAEIVMSNSDAAAARLMGVRTDGSAINRYVDRCPTDTVGASNTRMLVTVHSSTGLIECYAEDSADITFFVVGYWTNVVFTEMFDTIPIGAAEDGITVWYDWNISSTLSKPLNNRVIAAICTNYRVGGLRECGIRTDGSALARELDMMQANSTGVNPTMGANTFDTYVRVSPSGGIETSSELFSDNKIYITGYFGSNLNFTEAWATKGIGAGVWTDADLTAEIDADGDIVDFTLCNVYTTAAASSQGVRTNGDGTARYVQQGESIDGGPTGFGMTAQTDSNGIVELYSSAINELYKYGGYFTPVTEAPPPGNIAKIMGVTPPLQKIMGILYAIIHSINKCIT